MDDHIARPNASVRSRAAAASVPFGDVLYRYVLRARGRLRARVGDTRALLAPQVERAFERKLLGEVSEIAAPVLLDEFDAFRRVASPPTPVPGLAPS